MRVDANRAAFGRSRFHARCKRSLARRCRIDPVTPPETTYARFLEIATEDPSCRTAGEIAGFALERESRKRWAEIFNKELRSADAQRPDLLKLRPMLIRAFSPVLCDFIKFCSRGKVRDMPLSSSRTGPPLVARRSKRRNGGKDARMLRKHSERRTKVRERITTKRWHYVESTRNERET